MSIELKIPEVGESITEAQIARWLKQEGDAVEKDEAVVELETDKVSVEAPAPAAGVLGKILKQEGETANVGDVIAYIEENGKAGGTAEERVKEKEKRDGEAREEKRPETKEKRKEEKEESDKSAQAKSQDKPRRNNDEQDREASKPEAEPRVMPAARRALEEHGLTPEEIEATGPGGRLLKEDVQRHVESKQRDEVEPKPFAVAEESSPAAESGGGREEEAVPMSPMRRRIAERLVEVQQTAALLTTFNEIDMSSVVQLREQYRDTFEKRYGVRLGFMSFFVKASVEALKAVSQINASIRGHDIVYHNYYDIGIAVSTDRGLVVPILRNCERLSFAEIEQRIDDFATRAKEKKLKLEELEGGTFSITNGGVFGSMLSTPIVNPPQSAILGLHAIQDRPIAVNGEVVVRPMMYIALTYDHRLVDGREAVTFLKRIKEIIEDPARMMLEI